VGFPHVRVGHRQASKSKRAARWVALFLFLVGQFNVRG
jgi:hypothetical protein